ncbi:hypothetical protein [Poseidonocella sp. HB161398]|uniref:hypothetical protein n=1 Tax=Poseidonocella sp. HB161398 TaxID=2320855 RepID=UPI0019822179|nr:hypothetical protein [Poseidonocella sp. HB161398]
MTYPIRMTAAFLRPFELPGLDELLPPGDYEIELCDPATIAAGTGAASVLVRLHARASHPGLDRTLTLPLADLEAAIAKDKQGDWTLRDRFLEEMLADPMIRLVMKADGVGEAEMRDLYGTASRPEQRQGGAGPRIAPPRRAFDGTGPMRVPTRPGIGE